MYMSVLGKLLLARHLKFCIFQLILGGKLLSYFIYLQLVMTKFIIVLVTLCREISVFSIYQVKKNEKNPVCKGNWDTCRFNISCRVSTVILDSNRSTECELHN